MKQLRIIDIIGLINRLEREGMDIDEIIQLPIYLGDDEELNGIHNAWFCQMIDSRDNEDKYIMEMIDENNDHHKIILIS